MNKYLTAEEAVDEVLIKETQRLMKEFEEKEEAILSLLKGMTYSRAKLLLRSLEYRLSRITDDLIFGEKD